MASRLEENMQTKGFVLGVLRSSEILLKEEDESVMAQRLINELLDGKMKYISIKKIARFYKIEIDWKNLDITVKKTD
jgi:hypothetical protein